VFAAYLRCTQRCIDAYAVNAHEPMIFGRLVISIAYFGFKDMCRGGVGFIAYPCIVGDYELSINASSSA